MPEIQVVCSKVVEVRKAMSLVRTKLLHTVYRDVVALLSAEDLERRPLLEMSYYERLALIHP